MSATPTLPDDPNKPGSVWCNVCQQSLPAGRTSAHLASKKHSNTGGETAGGACDAADGACGAAPSKKGATASKKGAASRSLSRDPDREGNLWCGICRVSLTQKQSEGHLETKRHQDNAVKHLSIAMKSAKIPDL